MKTENVDVNAAAAYMAECEMVTEKFVRPYPPEFFAWLADAGMDLVRDELIKAKLDPKILTLFDDAAMMGAAARMALRDEGIDPFAGMAVAQSLPELLVFVIGKSTGFEPY
jgi:hypothetical protein